MNKFIFRYHLYIMFCGFILLCYSFLVLNYRNEPANHVYYGAMFATPMDLLGVLTITKQGYDGAWQNYLSHWQNVPGNPAANPSGIEVMQIPYIVFGHLARVIRMQPLTFLYTVRFILTLILAAVTVRLVRMAIDGRFERFLAVLLILFGVGVTWPWENWQTSPVIAGIGDSIMPFHRFTFVSHHYLLGHILTMVALIWYAKAKNRNTPDILVWGVLMGCLALVFMPSFLLVTGIMVLDTSVRLISRKTGTSTNRDYRPALVVVAVSLVSGLAVGLAVLNDTRTLLNTEWIIFLKWHILHYVQTTGLLLPFAVYGAFQTRNVTRSLIRLMGYAIVVHVLLTFVVQPAGLFSLKRMFQTPYHILFTLPAVTGMREASLRLARRLGIGKPVLIQCLMVLIIIISGLRTYLYCFPVEYYQETSPYTLAYPSVDIMSGIRWLDAYTRPREVVIAGINTAVLIPAFSGNLIYTSAWTELSTAENYIGPLMRWFFSGTMPQEEAERFLRLNGISYVFFGPEERTYGNVPSGLPYAGLVRSYENSSVIVYTVENAPVDSPARATRE